jgi:SAM-dependent methyltransferase
MTQSTTQPEETRIVEAVRERYAAAARKVTDEATHADDSLPMLAEAACCGGSACCSSAADSSVISADLYAIDEVADLPPAAVLASLGCGNPTALAELHAGETVLDLGSGGGIDVLLSARRVGPTGFAYGLDMTDEMLALAQQNATERGVTNVAFLKGQIENIPLPDASVDVVISNCVINLSIDKASVLREAFRVLKPGGRFAVSDVVVQGRLPAGVRRSMELWAGCVAGALEEATYRQLLADAGFADIGVEVTRVYRPADLAAGDWGSVDASTFSELEAGGGQLVSAFVRASKPQPGASALDSTTETAVPVAATDTSSCCSSVEQSACCEPAAKAACCGAKDETSSCGCH